MKPEISHRGYEMPSSPIRKLVGAARDAERRGTHVYRLNIGQPDVPTPPQALEALKHIDRKVLEYSPSEGIESLRVKMSEYYSRFGMDISSDEIIVTSGGSEAVLFAFMACLDPGDEIIIPEPAYANYMAFAISAGAVIKSVCADINDGFRLPPVEEFEALITPRTKGILICNPNNPTGYIYSEEELLKIADIVRRHNLFLFSDEVYREFCYTDTPFISAMSLPGIEENVVLIDSVSKRYNECGIRIGAIVTRHKELRANVDEILARLDVSARRCSVRSWRRLRSTLRRNTCSTSTTNISVVATSSSSVSTRFRAYTPQCRWELSTRLRHCP